MPVEQMIPTVVAPQVTAQHVGASGFAPRVRGDLRVSRSVESSMVLVTDPISGRTHQVHEIEWAVAREMDGTRRLEELLAIARANFSATTRAQLEQFVV